MTAEEIIKLLGMKPLPDEGGFYVETYRAADRISKEALGAKYAGQRSLATAILYLLTPETFSALHRLKSDEVFHFYLGDPITMLRLHPDGSSKVITLGSDIFNDQQIQVTVPAGTWQGAFLNRGGRFSLMGCTVAPGFEFADYESANRSELLKAYPAQRQLIIRLTANT